MNQHHDSNILSVFGSFDFREKVATIKLWWIRPKNDEVGLESQNGPHPSAVIS
jgi:hypothetical protein